MSDKLAKTIDDAWERRADIGVKSKGPVRKAVQTALELLDSGKARVAERQAARRRRAASARPRLPERPGRPERAAAPARRLPPA